jgi:hypothetical protein
MKFRMLLIVGLLASGCVRIDTGVAQPTFGEQIIDLARAHESGLISDAEFKSARRLLLMAF